jgi:penicillin-binding protein-related factor A (putative recombinase)
VVKSLKLAGMWAYKIADSPASWTASITRFTPDKPADIIACSKSGRFMLIESKQMKKWAGFYVGSMRDYQIKSLDSVTKISGRAYLFINVRIKKSEKNEYSNWCVIINWKKYGSLIKEKGISIKEMKEMKYGVWIKGKKGQFDLSGWTP